MPPEVVLEYGRRILQEDRAITRDQPANFLEFARDVADRMRDWPSDRQAEYWVRPFLLGLRKLENDFERIVERDPMILYKPAHEVSLAFHRSIAKIRYYMSGNRTSKTQTGYAEHYFVLTGDHRFRTYTRPPAATFIIGVDFTKYAPNVFERKLILGEPGNPLSPMFPEGGKWLHHYDDRKHILYIKCIDCITKEDPNCRHLSTMTLYSDNEGAKVLQGAQFNVGHFDEQIKEEFFTEAMQRLTTVPKSAFIITGTPLLGIGSWEYQTLLQNVWHKPKVNKMPGTQDPYVTVHTIDQYSAGLIPKDEIDANRLTMDPIEQESRIWGRPMALARNCVFDRYAIFEMQNNIEQPTFGYLTGEVTVSNRREMEDKEAIVFSQHGDGTLAVWQEPQEDEMYIIGCDVAAGMVDRDYSCASVLRLRDFSMVAQLHGWINPLDYAVQCARLGRWYNWAMLVPERTGLGVGMIAKLKEIAYWNTFRDLTDPSQAIFVQDPVYGVDTNIRSKAQMVACLQAVIKDRAIDIRCVNTLDEFLSFGQEKTPKGINIRLGAEPGAYDDRVMSLAFATYVAINYSSMFVPRRKIPATIDSTVWAGIHREIKDRQRSDRDQYFYGG
jgi:hypothetical protein